MTTTTTTTMTTTMTTTKQVKDDRLDAVINVSMHDQALADAISTAIKGALSSVPDPPPVERVVHLRTHKKLEELTAMGALAGAVVNVRVTERNARRLPDLVDAIRKANPLGVQLIWDGITPERARVEQHVFVVLERARATPGTSPVVLVKTAQHDEQPSLPLRFLIAMKGRNPC